MDDEHASHGGHLGGIRLDRSSYSGLTHPARLTTAVRGANVIAPLGRTALRAWPSPSGRLGPGWTDRAIDPDGRRARRGPVRRCAWIFTPLEPFRPGRSAVWERYRELYRPRRKRRRENTGIASREAVPQVRWEGGVIR